MEAKRPGQRSAVKAASRRSRTREARALTAHRWSGSGLPCDHGRTHAEHARQTATLRWVALGILIPNTFFVEAALGRFARCRSSAIQSNVQTDTYDPRRPGATPSLLSCRQTLVGALIPAVEMSDVTRSGHRAVPGLAVVRPLPTHQPASMRLVWLHAIPNVGRGRVVAPAKRPVEVR
jgi:hypothetical protein